MDERSGNFFHKVTYVLLLTEILCVLPWFVGIYEEIYTANQENIYYLGGGVLLGLVLGLFFLVQKRWKMPKARETVAWILWGGSLGGSYALIFQIGFLDSIFESLIGFGLIIVLLWYPGSKPSPEPGGNDSPKLTSGIMIAAGGFLFLNGWLALVNWAFQFLGVFFVACLNLYGLYALRDVGKIPIESPKMAPPTKRPFGISTISNFKLLIFFLVSAIVTLTTFAGVRDDKIKETQPEFLASLFIIAAVGVGSMAVLGIFGAKSRARKVLLFTGLGLITLCEFAFYTTGSIDLVWISVQLLIAGATLGAILAEILLFREPSRKTTGLSIILMILLFAGVLLLSDLAYPDEWAPLQMPGLVLAIIGGGISIFQIICEFRIPKSETKVNEKEGRSP